MSEDVIVDRVQSETTRIPGRSLNQARSHLFVVDSSSGPSEALTSIESFLGGISSCGVNIVHREAVERGFDLVRAEVSIESRRARADTSTLAGVHMRFTLEGVSQAQAQELVDTYTRR
jgi:uncharacterized OsmC-like protein